MDTETRNFQKVDDELVDGYLGGDISCFDQLLERYRMRLFHYIYRLIGQREEAEDIFQDVFNRVLDRIARYRKCGKFSAWIFTIALNRCRDHQRRKNKIMVVSLNQQLSNSGEETLTLENLLPSKAPLSSSEASKKEVQDILREAVAHLPPALKEVLQLRIYAQLSFKEISQVLHCPINTALGRMQYALQHLRKKLKEAGVSDEL